VGYDNLKFMLLTEDDVSGGYHTSFGLIRVFTAKFWSKKERI
jgi:hypothetical protein